MERESTAPSPSHRARNTNSGLMSAGWIGVLERPMTCSGTCVPFYDHSSFSLQTSTLASPCVYGLVWRSTVCHNFFLQQFRKINEGTLKPSKNSGLWEPLSGTGLAPQQQTESLELVNIMMDKIIKGCTLRNWVFVATTVHANPIHDITLLALVFLWSVESCQ